jgi:hypothetical protein
VPQEIEIKGIQRIALGGIFGGTTSNHEAGYIVKTNGYRLYSGDAGPFVHPEYLSPTTASLFPAPHPDSWLHSIGDLFLEFSMVNRCPITVQTGLWLC